MTTPLAPAAPNCCGTGSPPEFRTKFCQKSLCPLRDDSVIASPAESHTIRWRFDSAVQKPHFATSRCSLSNTSVDRDNRHHVPADVELAAVAAVLQPPVSKFSSQCQPPRYRNSRSRATTDGTEIQRSLDSPPSLQFRTSGTRETHDSTRAKRGSQFSRRAAVGCLSAFFAAMLSWQYQCMPAGAFSILGNSDVDKDPIEPFTIYGSL